MFNRYRLQNGLEVISEPMANRKTVALGVFVKVGSQDETRENNGISHLVEHMFFKGTGTKSAKEIADITARIGDDVNAFTSKECTALYGMTITEKLPELAALLGDLLTDPRFDAKELAKEKRIVMDEIDMYGDSPEDLVHELLQKRVWREDALGFLISGTKSVVRRVRREELQQFLREHYFAENMLVSAAGGYEEETLRDILEQAFGKIKSRKERQEKPAEEKERKGGSEISGIMECASEQKMPQRPSPERAAAAVKRQKAAELSLPPYHKEYGQAAGSKKETTEMACCLPPRYFRSFAAADRDIEQFHLNLAFPALCVWDKRRFAYSVFNSAFGGGSNSLLFQKIREEAGMAYSVYSYSSAYRRAGLFHIDITVQPQLSVPVLKKVAGIVEEFARTGLSGEELALHKQQVGTELVMSAESPKTRMDSNAKYVLAGAEVYTLEEKLTQIDAVDGAQLKELAGEILKLCNASICVVGNKNCANLHGLKRIWENWG